VRYEIGDHIVLPLLPKLDYLRIAKESFIDRTIVG
jgi:hypothetical protein